MSLRAAWTRVCGAPATIVVVRGAVVVGVVVATVCVGVVI